MNKNELCFGFGFGKVKTNRKKIFQDCSEKMDENDFVIMKKF